MPNIVTQRDDNRSLRASDLKSSAADASESSTADLLPLLNSLLIGSVFNTEQDRLSSEVTESAQMPCKAL